MWKIREIQDKVTNVVMNYTEVESKVREATNDDQWGPHGTVMGELAKHTYTYEHFPEVMGMLWKRMLLEKKNWRRVYKSLLLLSYLLRNGSERVVASARDHLYDMRQLEGYQHIDELGKDQGLNIRHKVKEVLEMIQDDSRLREERKKAKKNKDKYVGMSNDLIEDSYYSDRYSRDASYGRYGGRDDFKQQSKFQQIKDTIDNIRPGGKRDYSNYNVPSSRNEYRDEPENGVEVDEKWAGSDEDYKYKSSSPKPQYTDNIDDDDFQPRKETPSTPSNATKKTPTQTIDLGAAANYKGTSAVTNEMKTSDGFADFADFSSADTTPAPKPSNDLNDLMGAPLSEPIAPINPAGSGGGNVDLFGGFSSPAPTQTSSSGNDFANFESFGSFNQSAQSSIASNDLLQMSSAPLQPSNNSMMMPQQQPMNMMQQPNVMQSSGMMQPNMMQGPMQSPGNTMMQGSMQPPGNTMMQPMQSSGNMMSQRPVPTSNMITPQNPPHQHQQSNQNKSTLWANTGGLDISLDSLSPGAVREKPAMPSMNQMMPQQQYQQNVNMMNNRMANMNFSPQQQQPNASPMRMQPGMMQPMGGMGMRPMGVQQNVMSGMQMSGGMGMTMQPTGMSNNSNFTQFKAS